MGRLKWERSDERSSEALTQDRVQAIASASAMGLGGSGGGLAAAAAIGGTWRYEGTEGVPCGGGRKCDELW